MLKIKRYSPVLLLSLLMTLMILYSVKAQLDSPFDWVTFRDPVSGMELRPYYNQNEGKYYLFIPAHTTPEEILTEIPPVGVNLRFTKEVEHYGDSLGDVPLEQDVLMTIGVLKWGWSALIQVWQNEKLPSLCVTSDKGLLEYLGEDKSNAADVAVTLFEPDGSVSLERVAQMNGRGNGSWWGKSKRPYNLSFDSGVSVGPFKEIEKFCLLAEFSDESKMRNALAYYVGEELTVPYASPYMYVDLYINGEYRGLYGVVTKQEYKKRIEEDGIKAVFEITSSTTDVDFTVEGKKYAVMHGDPQFIRQYVTDLEGEFTAGGGVH